MAKSTCQIFVFKLSFSILGLIIAFYSYSFLKFGKQHFILLYQNLYCFFNFSYPTISLLSLIISYRDNNTFKKSNDIEIKNWKKWEILQMLLNLQKQYFRVNQISRCSPVYNYSQNFSWFLYH